MATYFGTYGHSSYRPYVSITVNSQNIAANTTTITCEFGMYKASANSASYDLYAQTYSYSINGVSESRSVTYDFRSKAVGTYNKLFAVSKVISHNADGTKAINVSAYHPTGTSLNPGSLSVTGFSLPTIPRATTPALNKTSASIGESVTITTTGASSAFSHLLSWSLAGGSGKISGNVLNIDESFALLLPKSVQGTLVVTCDTYSGSTKIGTKTANLTVNVPSSFGPDLKLTGSFKNQLNENNLKNITSMTVHGDATAYGGSSIVKYQYYVNSDTPVKTNDVAGLESDEYEFILDTVGTIPIEVKVTDSRGYTKSMSLPDVTVYDYESPLIEELNTVRCLDDDIRALKVSGKMQLSATMQGNSYAYEIYSRKRIESEENKKLIKSGPLANEETFTILVDETSEIAFADEESFVISMAITDTLGNVDDEISNLPTEIVTADFRRNAIGFGKYVEDEELLDCAWDFKARSITTTEPFFSSLSEADLGSLRDLIYPVGSIYMSANEVNPGDFIGGTWEAYATGRTIIGAGTGKDTAGKSLAFSGGSSGGEYSHTLTIAEMPSHTHIQNAHRHTLVLQKNDGYAAKGTYVRPLLDATSGYVGMTQGGVAMANTTATNQYTGGSGAHNNLPPYITCFIWRRTA